MHAIQDIVSMTDETVSLAKWYSREFGSNCEFMPSPADAVIAFCRERESCGAFSGAAWGFLWGVIVVFAQPEAEQDGEPEPAPYAEG